MKSLCFAYPGDLETPTGGYGYDRQIIAGLKRDGWKVDLLPLGDGFPFPDDQTLATARKRLNDLPGGRLVVVDGLAFGVMPDAAIELKDRLKLVALVHHPLCRENGLSNAQAHTLESSERAALSGASHVIVTSPATGDQVSDLFEIQKKKISVVLPGTDLPAPRQKNEQTPVRLLAVGTLVYRKGYDLLLMALSRLKQFDWQLDIVGGLEADPACANEIQRLAQDFGLEERLVFHGAIPSDELKNFYQSADVFVLASRYEGYGMAYTEAMAHGLAVIGSGGGAVRDTLPQGAALYCPPDDITSLQSALESLITDRDLRQKLSVGARQAAEKLPGWHDASERFSQILQRVSE
ncbi:glycosyltransferase family 4 protein [Roseibium porphyridii]|uniref:Glycosyltransferase family 4 protein n=1 Tax=Roseibium porphyridii TaxID=2866279 RepID=A0ABY8F2D5_9HYPH|nr:glycosyltransferase family 4 protein [Roseibium sp. KMA01]WFE89391.1 glycosyltransferase family 4 protein [Roseibium sp. KMA01]